MKNEIKNNTGERIDFTEKTLSSELVYDCGFLRLMQDRVELPNGRESGRCYVKHNGGVCIAAIDDDENVVLVRQYRYPMSKEILELPAGKIDIGEAPDVCGKRELLEEVGVTAETFTPLGLLYPSPGYSSENIYMYLAEGLHYGDKQPDEDEFLDTVIMPFEKAYYQAMTGGINDAKSIICLARAEYYLRNRRHK